MSSASETASAYASAALEKLQTLESRAWQYTNNWIDEQRGRDFEESEATWRSWVWSRTSGAISRVRGAVIRNEPSLPR